MNDFLTARSSRDRKASRTAALCISLALLLAGCRSEEVKESSPAPQRTVNTRLLYPREIDGLMRTVAGALDTSPIRTADGSVIKVATSTTDPVWVAGPTNPFEIYRSALWISPSTHALALARERLAGQKISLDECAPLFRTEPVVAFRALDHFLIERLGDPLDFEAVLEFVSEDAATQPLIVAGLPASSASGLAAYLGTARAALNRDVQLASVQEIDAAVPAIAGLQNRFSRYFTRDWDMLAWLGAQDGGQPILAITSAQQVKALAKRPSAPQLATAPIPGVVPDMEYQICLTNGPWLTSMERSAARAVHAQLLRPETVEAAKAEGFEPLTRETGAGEPDRAGASLAALAAKWDEVRRPIDLTIVVDSSANTEGAKINLVKRDLAALLLPQQGKAFRGTVTVISSSTRAEVLASAESGAAPLKAAFEGLKSSGASCSRDGLSLALDRYNDSATSNNRRAIVLLVNGPDTSSRVTAAELKARLEETLARRKIALYLVGLGAGMKDVGDLAEIVRSSGGSLILAPAESFAASVLPVVREVS